jgi:hypothetical protein
MSTKRHDQDAPGIAELSKKFRQYHGCKMTIEEFGNLELSIYDCSGYNKDYNYAFHVSMWSPQLLHVMPVRCDRATARNWVDCFYLEPATNVLIHSRHRYLKCPHIDRTKGD